MFSLAFASPHTSVYNQNLQKANEDLGVQEKLGTMVSPKIEFRDETNQIVTLDTYFNKKNPVIITPVYYLCPHLCGLVLNGVADAINQEKSLKLGKDYEIVTITMNPDEDYKIATDKKKEYLKLLTNLSEADLKVAESGWHFLTGTSNNIETIFKEVGFRYKKEGNDYAHSATIIFLTPALKIARYLYGVNFKGNDFKLSLIEASEGKISSFVSRLMVFCFAYDHSKRVYNIVAWKVMMFGVGSMLLMVLVLLSVLWFRDKKHKT